MDNWPFMRCKNTLRYLRLPVSRNHQECLETLARYFSMSVDDLLKLNAYEFLKPKIYYLTHHRGQLIFPRM